MSPHPPPPRSNHHLSLPLPSHPPVSVTVHSSSLILIYSFSFIQDLRTIDVILESYYCKEALEDNAVFSSSGVYFQPPVVEGEPHTGYMDYIKSLPINPAPEAFGMHNNANITSAQNETYECFNVIVSLQPRQASGAGMSREDVIAEQVRVKKERKREREMKRERDEREREYVLPAHHVFKHITFSKLTRASHIGLSISPSSPPSLYHSCRSNL